MQRRIAHLPLHGGKAPAWLFKRMSHLAGAVTMTIVEEYGPEEMLRRLADPWWFQAFGCVLGFDWHSSGLTTVTCGALRDAQKRLGNDLGILAAGGKGATSRKTPQQIAELASRHGITEGERLIYASRMSAKVDSAAVLDSYQIYAHMIFFTPAGAWCVVQQGMNENAGAARRYHWLGKSVTDFVCEPHAGVHNSTPSQPRQPFLPGLLNMVAEEADQNREASASLVREPVESVLREVARLTEGPTLFAPNHHRVLPTDVNVKQLHRVLRTAHERCPQDFETLLGTKGVGPATIRALSLLAEVIHNAPASHRDLGAPQPDAPTEDTRKWADYSYAHGGKDGTPFPVDRTTYDQSIEVLLEALRRARIGDSDRSDALRRLAALRPR
ncbi:MAG: DUF763 domain-containing protein [Lentisphaerae bacterium]|jgi:uncharacterized protein|nr:DUF763 domain-containing protein [Lentisphaerota bacterium]MBT5608791.1 DUF763 domain-containing protein [Lentisphaerota bacterium]MBT7058302.1 DUF763 domain-containing protein [Lentisphaerota bacterium]MBT7840277.1 DUF763 domain-containing protein [Lentisphaerota bacterium]